jgi:4-hydroxymandelate oxidase
VANLDDLLNVEEFAALAEAKLEPAAYDYYRNGSGDEITVAENITAWRGLGLRPRVLVDVSQRNPTIDLFGQRVAAPLLVAPTALHQMADPEGEVATGRGASAADIPLVLSSLSTRTIEDVAAVTTSPLVMQIYIAQDRDFTTDLARRAQAAGCRALMVTLDTPIWGTRERDIRNKFHVPKGMKIANLERPGQPTGHRGSGLGEALSWTIDPSLTWADLETLARAVDIPVWVKGVLRADDAVRAIDHGAAGIAVSNHGGRQLDGTIATARALPEVVAAVNGQAPVVVDGGIRRGSDILRAIALGATAVQVGRPVLWGLAAGGAAGVTRVLELLITEFSDAMALAGCAHIDEITPDLIAKG